MADALLLHLALPHRRVHVADQVAQGAGEGVDAVFGAAVAQWGDQGDVDDHADAAPDEDQQDDLSQVSDLVDPGRCRDIGGEGEEGRRRHLGALRPEGRPPADGERHHRHQGEGEQVRAGQVPEDGLHGDAGRHRPHVPQRLQQGLVHRHLHDQDGGERRERR